MLIYTLCIIYSSSYVYLREMNSLQTDAFKQINMISLSIHLYKLLAVHKIRPEPGDSSEKDRKFQ